MKESNQIINRFSDAYVAAILDGTDPTAVVELYLGAYPELSASVHQSAASLGVLYSYLPNAELPSDSEITAAYLKLNGSTALVPELPSEPNFFSRIGTSISSTPNIRILIAAATVGLGLFLWHPWNSPVVPDNASLNVVNSSNTITPSSSPINTDVVPASDSSLVDAASRARADRARTAEAVAHAKQLSLTGQVPQPKELHLSNVANQSIRLNWQPVHGAASYLVEIKTKADRQFHAVVQVNRPKATLEGFDRGQKVSIRVTAIHGPVKGPASEAKHIVIR